MDRLRVIVACPNLARNSLAMASSGRTCDKQQCNSVDHQPLTLSRSAFFPPHGRPGVPVSSHAAPRHGRRFGVGQISGKVLPALVAPATRPTARPTARPTSPIIAHLPPGVHRLLLRLVQPWRLRLWGLLRREVEGIMVLGFDSAGRVLLVRHSYHLPDQWLVPGGGRAAGEDAIATARREMAEEAGCTLHDPAWLGQIRRTMPGGWINRIELVTGRITGTPRADGREILAVTLAAPDALPPGTHPAVHDYLALWRAQQAGAGSEG